MSKPLYDGEFTFPSTSRGVDSACWLRIYREAGDPGAFIAIAWEIKSNQGMSVTNGAEDLWTRIRRMIAAELVRPEHKTDPDAVSLRTFEIYDDPGDRYGHKRSTRISEVGGRWDGKRYMSATWQPATLEALEELIGCDLDHAPEPSY